MADKNLSETLHSLKQIVYNFISQGQNDQNTMDNEQNEFDADITSEFRLNEAVSSRVRGIINDFIEAAPLIESAGFRIKELEIELSVIPKLIPHFEKFSESDEAARLQILQQVKNKRLIGLLLKALFKADSFQKSLNMGSLEFASIEIEITAIPAVRLVYKNPVKSTNKVTDLAL